jgi:hypothetical protein
MAETAKQGRSKSKETSSPPADGSGSHQGEHVCTVGFCPICLAVTAVQPLRPEAVEHLVNAGREFLLAMSAILGARAEGSDGKETSPTLTRIDIE